MAVAGNKYYALRLAEGCGENTGGIYLYTHRQGWCNGRRPPAGEKIIIKPALECASIGIDEASVRYVDNTLEDELASRAEFLRQPLLVQPFVPGYEIEVPVYGAPEPIAPAAYGIMTNGVKDLGDHFLTYDRVYRGEYAFYPIFAEDPRLESQLRASACRVFSELGLRGFARMDYRVRNDGSWAITDINAIPHLTPDASNSLAFATLDLTYPEVLKLVTAAGLIDWRKTTGETSIGCQ
jgi:D-alanine-D-alanine ligase